MLLSTRRMLYNMHKREEEKSRTSRPTLSEDPDSSLRLPIPFRALV
jgi:hypothetical protein